MKPIDESSKAPENLEQSEKSESLLFRLWEKYIVKKDSESLAPEDTNTQPQAVVVEEPVELEKNGLHRLWEKWCGQEATAAEFALMKFVSADFEAAVAEDAQADQPEQPNKQELLRFESALILEAQAMLQQTAEAQAVPEQTNEEASAEEELSPNDTENSEPEPSVPMTGETEPPSPIICEPEPVNAQVRVRVSKDKLKAWVFVFPPFHAGGEVTQDALKQALAQEGVVYGVNETMLQRLCQESLYFKVIEAASGESAVDGKDGEIVHCFPLETKLEIVEDEYGIVDYKSMNLIRNIKKGDVVSNIIQATEPVSGVDITGKKVNGKQGKPPFIQKSSGIELSESGNELVAAIDGQLSFKDDKFVVEKLLVIEGDVDSSTGNIDFNGDVTVQGDVREGFQLKAKGSIIVKGMVEDTLIVSGGSIIVEKGMNGNGKGTIEAQGDIKCKFIENCTANAGGNVYAGSIICSNVCCNGELIVTTGKGVIIGGSCTVHKLLEARVIGSKSNRSTTIVMGNTPDMVSKKMEAETQLKNLQAEIESINKDMAFIEAGGRVSRDRQASVNQVKLKRPLLLMQEKQLQKQIDKLNDEMEDVSESRIKCGTIYPPTKLVIGNAKLIVEEVHNHCNIYYSDGEIVIGTQ